jgi:hypothetical protein
LRLVGAIDRLDGLGGEQPTIPRRLQADIECIGSLDSGSAAAMFDLYSRYYDAASEAVFTSDLHDKDFVVLLRDSDRRIKGFSTVAVIDVVTDTGRLRALYSGDTIIDRAHWGTQALAFTWLRLAGRIKAQVPVCPLYWFLIVKGHRTYRYLSAFSVDFYPNWKTPTPTRAEEIMAWLARRQFADAYRPELGIVSYPQSRGHLKPQWAEIDPEEAARPDVCFFLAHNPRYVRGDELVCLTELSSENLRPLARRVFEQGLHE